MKSKLWILAALLLHLSGIGEWSNYYHYKHQGHRTAKSLQGHSLCVSHAAMAVVTTNIPCVRHLQLPKPHLNFGHQPHLTPGDESC